jgi:polyhydroxyalkanoate synthesis regulator phasin
MKSSIYLKTLAPLLAALILLANPASATVVTLTVGTDKTAYLLGEMVTINGTVKEDNVAKAYVYVNVEVRDPSGTLRFADVVMTGADGKYSTGFRLAETLPTGTYTVKAVYAGVSKTASFTVSSAPTYTLTITPDTLVVPVGFYGTVEVQVKAVGAYIYKVTLSAAEVKELTVAFTKATATPDFKSIAVVAASTEAVKGTYTAAITATGEDGTIISKNLTVIVVDAPPAVTELEDRISKLESDIEAVKKDVSALKTDVSTLKDAITAIQTRLLKAETAISNLTSDVNSLTTSVNALRDSVDSLTRSVNDLKATVGGISGAAYGAIVLSIIALVVAIYAMLTLRKKVAG